MHDEIYKFKTVEKEEPKYGIIMENAGTDLRQLYMTSETEFPKLKKLLFDEREIMQQVKNFF